MIKRITDDSDLILKFNGSIDNVKLQYYTNASYNHIEAVPDSNGVVILYSQDLTGLSTGQLIQKAIYKIADVSFPDGSYDKEVITPLDYWLTTESTEPEEKDKYYTKNQIDNIVEGIEEQIESIDVTEQLIPLKTDITNLKSADVTIKNDITSLKSADTTIKVDILKLKDVDATLQSSIVSINAILDIRFPFTITSFTGVSTREKGTTYTASLAWIYYGTPTIHVLPQNCTEVETELTDRSKSVPGITTDTTFVISANGKTKSISVSFYNCKYVGVVSNAPTNESGVKAMTKLAVASSKSYTWNGNLTNQRVCYAYPKAFGTLSSIKDANGFDYISGYSRTEVTVNSEVYYVYTSSASTITGFRQIFA